MTRVHILQRATRNGPVYFGADGTPTEFKSQAKRFKHFEDAMALWSTWLERDPYTPWSIEEVSSEWLDDDPAYEKFARQMDELQKVRVLSDDSFNPLGTDVQAIRRAEFEKLESAYASFVFATCGVALLVAIGVGLKIAGLL